MRVTVVARHSQNSRIARSETLRLPIEKVLQLLLRASQFVVLSGITGLEKKTILSLLQRVSERCEMLLENLVRNVPVKDVQCDELWAFVQMKEKTKTKKALTTEKLGDAYCFVAIERTTKLVLSWHLGPTFRWRYGHFY